MKYRNEREDNIYMMESSINKRERKKLREEYQKKFPLATQECNVKFKIKGIEEELEEIEAKYGKKGMGKVLNGVSIVLMGMFFLICILLAKSMPKVWLFPVFALIFGISAVWSVFVLKKCIEMDKKREKLAQTLCDERDKLEAIKKIITFESILC